MEKKICTVDGYDNDSKIKGLCIKHYAHLLRNGDPEKYLVERHGMTNSPEYKSWKHMKERCYNPNNNRYYCYGARGITVCDRWKNSFIAFYEDMGPKPFPKAQIDREKNDLGYFKDNCHWTTSAVNAQNRSTTRANPKLVKEIRNKYKLGQSQISMCKEYNLIPRVVNAIVLNKTWKNIK